MGDVEADQLQQTVESMHSCRATLAEVVPVRESFRGGEVWEGTVHVFRIEGHPKATQAYAWSIPVEESEKYRFFAVLQLDAIKSPADALRSVIIQEQRKGR